MSDGIVLGTLPAGTLIIRRANSADLAIDGTRILLVQEPGKEPRWLHMPSFAEYQNCLIVTHDVVDPEVTIEIRTAP